MKNAFSPLRLFVLLIVMSTPLIAQISISDGTSKDVPNPDAAFEVSSSTQGILLPRLKLVSTDSPKPLRAFTEGMVVYNLAQTEGDNPVAPGLYVCDGVRWIRSGSTQVVIPSTPAPSSKLRGVYAPPMECKTFDITVNATIPENATVLLTLEHAGESPTCLSIRQIDRVRGVISVNSSQLLPTFARIHWMVVE